MKTCTKCKTEKPKTEFHKRSGTKSGLKSKCKLCRNQENSIYQKENPEKNREKVKRYQRKNPEKVAERKRKWRTSPEGRGIKNASTNRRRANKLRATPSWADLEKIKEIYINCPPGHHVDHVIPLQGKTVCGLHVENNLQYLTAEENLKKGNKIPCA